jgi:hypothetical protein
VLAWTTAEWAQVVSAVSAGVAAIAAAIAVGLALRRQKLAIRPNLSAGVTRGVPSGKLGASFTNGGPGVAVQVGYMLVCGNFKKTGMVKDGHLATGEKAILDFDYLARADERAYFVWACRDVDSNVYMWSSDWDSHRFSRRRWLKREDYSMESMFKLMYPNVAIPG